MRTTRAYLAGLGTAGSIVVGAALVFVLASAVVAFHGWPSADGIDTPARVVVSAPALSATPAARRLVALVTRPRQIGISSAPRAAVTAVVHAHRTAVVAGAGGFGVPVSRIGGQPTTRPTQPPAATPGRTTSTPVPPTTTLAPPTTVSVPSITIPTPPTAGGGTSGPVGTVVKKVTGTVGGTVSGTGSGVGTIVKQVTAPVGGPVSGVGSGLGDTITKVTGRFGGILGGG